MRKRLILIISIIIVGCLLVSCLTIILKNKDVTDNSTKVISQIKDYGYSLDDRDTIIFKEEFKNLEDILKNEEINFEEYAISLSKLFVIDFYTLTNKVNSYDVGALEYLDKKIVDNFKLKARNTIYKNLDALEKIPEVKKINSTKIEESTYKIEQKEYEALKVFITWEYKENLGYDASAEITFIRSEDKLYVVHFSAE